MNSHIKLLLTCHFPSSEDSPYHDYSCIHDAFKAILFLINWQELPISWSKSVLALYSVIVCRIFDNKNIIIEPNVAKVRGNGIRRLCYTIRSCTTWRAACWDHTETHQSCVFQMEFLGRQRSWLLCYTCLQLHGRHLS